MVLLSLPEVCALPCHSSFFLHAGGGWTGNTGGRCLLDHQRPDVTPLLSFCTALDLFPANCVNFHDVPAGLQHVLHDKLDSEIKQLLAQDARAAGVPFDQSAIPTSGPAFAALAKAEQVCLQTMLTGCAAGACHNPCLLHVTR